MKTVLTLAFVSLLCLACSSAPTEPAKDQGPPAWTTQAARRLDGSTLIYVGAGEDRSEQNARYKAEAFALQDLSNDCSFVPKGAQIQDHYEESVGILYRVFAEVRVSVDDCQKARGALTTTQIHELGDTTLNAEVVRYQSEYDAPEPTEAAKLGPTTLVQNTARLFVVRQQVALTKQKDPTDVGTLASASLAISRYQEANPDVWNGTQAFSTSRPNWFKHQPAAVRDSIMDRARIEQAYPQSPTPPLATPSKNQGKKGGRRRQQQQQVPQQPQQPTPPPSMDGGAQAPT
jgi:hypothetical protein